MKPSNFPSGFAAGFLVVFLLDGIVTLASDLLSSTGYLVEGLESLRISLAALVTLWAIPLFLAVILAPRFQKRFLLPACCLALWAGLSNCFPLGLQKPLLDAPVIPAVQIILGLAAVLSWRHSGKPLWIEGERPPFSWGSLLAGFALGAAIILMAIGNLAGTAMQAVDNRTGGYVKLRPSGLYLAEKTFRRQDKEVRLVGMIHIAQESFYDSIAADIQKRPAIVLLEGVSDRKGLLKQRFSYNGLADFIGIASQERSAFTASAGKALHDDEEFDGDFSDPDSPVQFKHADLDVSVFQPQTLLLVEEFGTILASQDWKEALTRLTRKDSILNNDKAVNAAMLDLIQTRNKHLMGSLRSSLSQTNLIIIPWGAAHLADLQRELEQMGFREVESKARQAMSFLPL